MKILKTVIPRSTVNEKLDLIDHLDENAINGQIDSENMYLSTWMSGYREYYSERLLISSLPGKALRTLVEIARLVERFNMRSQSRA